ncbi:D-amino-acid oxidase-like protein [Paraphaeosphaeria sporulosa]|uniref:D-amino-acid oxidase-like protein n=1 Tax=Paraphaeosphaeria sporulosa TaxID=1460663 RepID=A0A177BZ92_9PLEO|nr:D-amino-acid oxidase-like protein [Paraphaeosphaeria sporulosa]OAG00844.1 D-amino-acid oxidase-like protein [Paraphaeosphaeria sporulosa]
MPSKHGNEFVVLGAGVIGLSSALALREAYPSSAITVVAKHFPGDRSIDYTSPWAGANWSSMATDNGPLEGYDRVTFNRFAKMVDEGLGDVVGVGRMGLRAVFDAEIEQVNVLSQGTGKIWYEELVGGMRFLEERELPQGAVFGLDFKSTFRLNTQVYLNWLQQQAIEKGIKTVRRHYPSIKAILEDYPSTTALVNCSALGSLHLEDVKDTNLYPTRGQTILVAEPKVPIERMYLRTPKRVDPTVAYVFPRPNGGGVILGGSRQDNDWSAEPDMSLAQTIMQRCCSLCPELGKPEDLQVISHNVGLRPSRKGGPRIEVERWADGTPVVHNYGHAGAGYQSSWGTAERVVELVGKALEKKARL